jgi:hypothetical protein
MCMLKSHKYSALFLRQTGSNITLSCIYEGEIGSFRKFSSDNRFAPKDLIVIRKNIHKFTVGKILIKTGY